MRPLGYIENYENFADQFWEVLLKEGSIGFLLDCPKSFALEKSGLINSPRVIESMNTLMESRMSIYYLTPKINKRTNAIDQKEYRNIASAFNEEIISGLKLPFKVSYPCLLLFKSDGDHLVDRIYLDLGRDSCFYFEDLYKTISAYLKQDDPRGLGSRMVNIFKHGCQAISEELPKTVLLKSIEMGAALLIGFAGIKGVTGT
jgi:hypothetical protein